MEYSVQELNANLVSIFDEAQKEGVVRIKEKMGNFLYTLFDAAHKLPLSTALNQSVNLQNHPIFTVRQAN